MYKIDFFHIINGAREQHMTLGTGTLSFQFVQLRHIILKVSNFEQNS